MSVARMRREVSGSEWVDWNAYYVIKQQREEVEMKKARNRR